MDASLFAGKYRRFAFIAYLIAGINKEQWILK
jgi:hypothetical protein